MNCLKYLNQEKRNKFTILINRSNADALKNQAYLAREMF